MSAPDYTKIENPTSEWRRAEFNRRSGLSRPQYYSEILPLVEAISQDKILEELNLNGHNNWEAPSGNNIVLANPGYIYRIKQAPQPKWIPWTIDTAPILPIWVRRNGKTTRHLVLSISAVGVSTPAAHISYNGLLEEYEFTSALIPTLDWKPCGTLTDPKLNENKS